MQNFWTFTASSLLALTLALPVAAADLPEGPIRDRHELMEEIGKNAKALGAAAKAGDAEALGTAAAAIQAAAPKIADLFPKGSTHPASRAKSEIWESWERFVELARQLETAAGNAVKVAREGGNLGETTGPIFRTCKGCHEEFREPEEDEGSDS